MKNLFYLMIGMIVLVGLSYSQSITVTSPGASTYTQADTLSIQWSVSGITGNVKIILRKSDGSGGTVLQETYPATGSSYSHSLADVASGDYFIKIKQGTISGKSPVFTVLPKEATMVTEITVTNPNSGTFKSGKDILHIVWTTSGISGNVKINLRKKDGSGGIIILPSHPFNGSPFNWKIPKSTATGEYFIKIKQGSVFGKSNVFKIKSNRILELNPEILKLVKIKIIKPSSSSFWKGGTKHDIVWENKHANNKKLKIDLYSFDGKEFIKNIYTKNYLYTNPNSSTSKYSWTVPDIGPKKCKIKISIIDGIGKGTSDMFTLTIATKIKKYKIFGTTYNKVKWRKAERYGNTDPVYYETPTVGNPGPGKMRFGSESFHNETSSSSYLYRSYIFFDVSQLKGKGVILKAKFHYTVYKTTGNCGISKGNVHIVDEAWESKIFTCSLTTIYQSTNLTPFITKWVANSESNFGFAVLAKEAEHYMIWGQDTKCYAFAKNVYLEIDIIENK